MSRNIKGANLNIPDPELTALRDDRSGKLLFTTYRQKSCAFFIRNERLVAASLLPTAANTIGAIYIGKVKNVVSNINACFVEIANGEICFLPMKEAQFPYLLNRVADGRILQGDEFPVQINREAHKTKQASLTTNLSLSNDYVAISIGSGKIGFSNKLLPETKKQMKEELIKTGWITDQGYLCDTETLANHLDIPTPFGQNSLPPMGFVVRTKAGECTGEEFFTALKSLFTEFLSLLQTSTYRTCFSCLKEAPQSYETVSDKLVFPNEYQEIITDNPNLFENLNAYYSIHDPSKKVRLYQDASFSLCKLYSLESKMDVALGKRIWLKSGGYLIIEQTEAMTVIDVNSGKYEAKKPSEDTAWIINKEAAEEIALQLRLRNLSGIIVVDFINMSIPGREKELLEYCRYLVSKDKIKTSVIDITALGLMEITRKKQNKTLAEQFMGERK